MALYRCAACGSPNVVTDTVMEGYDYVKGAIGTAVLGVGGAAAGVNGKKQTVYKCPDCGITLTYPMPDEIRQIIDMGEQSEEARKNATLRGIEIPWSVLTAKYKNIKTVYHDSEHKSSAVEELKKIFMFDYSSDEGHALLETARPQYESAKAKFISRYKAKMKAKADQLEALAERKKELEEEIKNLNSELSGLGLFKFAKKNELREAIEKKNAELSKCTKDCQAVFKEITGPSAEANKHDDFAKGYAALQVIGHAAVPKQVMQVIKFYEKNFRKNDMQVACLFRIMKVDGYLTSDESFLEDPNNMRAYQCV